MKWCKHRDWQQRWWKAQFQVVVCLSTHEAAAAVVLTIVPLLWTHNSPRHLPLSSKTNNTQIQAHWQPVIYKKEIIIIRLLGFYETAACSCHSATVTSSTPAALKPRIVHPPFWCWLPMSSRFTAYSVQIKITIWGLMRWDEWLNAPLVYIFLFMFCLLSLCCVQFITILYVIFIVCSKTDTVSLIYHTVYNIKWKITARN